MKRTCEWRLDGLTKVPSSWAGVDTAGVNDCGVERVVLAGDAFLRCDMQTGDEIGRFGDDVRLR